jgi:hypothetical protein
MTVMEAWATGRQTRSQRRARKPLLAMLFTLAGRYLPRWVTVRRFATYATAFGLIDAAAWQFTTWSGLLVAGLSVLALDYMSGDE